MKTKPKTLHRLFCSSYARHRVRCVSAAVTGIKSGIWIWTLIVINNWFHPGHIHQASNTHKLLPPSTDFPCSYASDQVALVNTHTRNFPPSRKLQPVVPTTWILADRKYNSSYLFTRTVTSRVSASALFSFVFIITVLASTFVWKTHCLKLQFLMSII